MFDLFFFKRGNWNWLFFCLFVHLFGISNIYFFIKIAVVLW